LDEEASRDGIDGAIRRGRAVENARVARTCDGEAKTARESSPLAYLDAALLGLVSAKVEFDNCRSLLTF
jgi:hypothetical protein